MGDKTNIQWTDATWNPLRGCSRVSEGCRHCYAEAVAARFSGPGQPYEGLARATKTGPRWTGRVRFVPDKLLEPLRWTKPRRVFVNSMSDLFHERVPDAWIVETFAVMAMAPQHTFQALTKRAARMRDVVAEPTFRERVGVVGARIWARLPNGLARTTWDRAFQFGPGGVWPLPNVWLGVSCEDQPAADARVPALLATPAAVRFVSAEPLLAVLTLRDWVEDVPQRPRGRSGSAPLRLNDRKGGDPAEWPPDLRIREWPATSVLTSNR